MPFNAKFDELYENHLRRLIKRDLESVECFRMKEFHSVKEPRAKVMARKIKECRFAIADITGNNPNVFYEIGYARALEKPVILIKNKQIGKLPFDIQDLEVLIYDRDKIGYNDINKQILATISNDLSDIIKTPEHNIQTTVESNTIVGMWIGQYSVRNVKQEVTLYINRDEKEIYTAYCLVHIDDKGKQYRIRETLHYNNPLTDWHDGNWIEFIGTTYFNETANRLDYWMDVYAINTDISRGGLWVKIWDNVNREKKDVFFTRNN